MARDEAYRKAEEKIEAARRLGAKGLDLIGMGLTELPESLGRLTQLRALRLSLNQLTALPESLGQLTQLQELKLSNNQLTALPEWLGQLTQLQSLYLNGNRLTALPESLGRLTQLRLLDLSRNQLTALPESLGQLTQLQSLDLGNNRLTALPESLGRLTQLQSLDLAQNRLTALPESLGQLTQLQLLNLTYNQLTALPESVSHLKYLEALYLGGNSLEALPDSMTGLKSLKDLKIWGLKFEPIPEWVGELTWLRSINLASNKLTRVPDWLSRLRQLEEVRLHGNLLTDLPTGLSNLDMLRLLALQKNPLNPELAAAYKEGLDAVKRYLRAKAEAQVVLNEAKLILIGEGEVGKSCLLDALCDDPWRKHVSTHGIEIKPVCVTHRDGAGVETKITLNTWDFGGQKVYRPTHQLFFSSSAVYLVVWKPREGPQQGAIEYWINTIKHRAGPDAKVLVVATHGGPQQRQPDVDLQDLRDKFGADTILGAWHVDSRPANHDEANDTWLGPRKGMDELKRAIADAAAALPNVGREVPASWSRTLVAVRERSVEEPYISYAEFLKLCAEQGVSDTLATTYAAMLNELGYVIHYGADDDLKEIVILKPDWLAKAISFVLDDKETRERHGLVSHDRLSELWNHPPYENEKGYDKALHPLFRRLMERFDLSYQVVLDPAARKPIETNLIAQLVDDQPLDLPDWGETLLAGDVEKKQVCQIVEKEKSQSANAEGLFYRLIARLHKYSLGREDYSKSIHWQRGLMLDDGYNGQAVLKHIGNDIHITVRAAYPDFLLYELTKEVKWLVENPDEGWAGLRCVVMVPCIEPCGLKEPGCGMFEVGKLKESKRRGRPDYPCDAPGCDEWQNIDCLLQNAIVTRKSVLSDSEVETALMEIKAGVNDLKVGVAAVGADLKKLISLANQQFAALMTALTDEAKEGPRLFSFEPATPGFWDKPEWVAEKFRLTLWCEHSRLPLTHPGLNDGDKSRGVYEVELTRDWVNKSAPFLKVLSDTLSLALPIASAGVKLAMDATTYKAIENQLNFGKACAESFLKGADKVGDWIAGGDESELEAGRAQLAQGAELRELHALLKAKDPGNSFGGLVRVQDKRRNYHWVHPEFEKEY